MKLLTIHREFDGKPVDFEVYDDGKIVVAGHDIEADEAAYGLGFEASNVLWEYWQLQDKPYDFFSEKGLMGPLFAEKSVIPVLLASTAHMTSRDDDTLRDRASEKLYEASGLHYDDTEYGYLIYMHEGFPPRETVEETKNKDNLSESLVDVLQLAFDHGIYLVQFDNEAPEIDGIETHEW